MALPKAARKQIEEAEKLHAEAYAGNEEPVEPPKLEEVPPVEPPVEPPEEPPAEIAAETPPADSNAGKENDAEHWKHKYNVLQGKYDAEVPRLQQENNSIRGQIADLQAQVNEALTPPAAQEPITPQTHLSGEEIDDYGEDMIAVVKKAAREEFEPVVAQLQTENEQLRGLLGGVQQQNTINARQTMLDSLDEQLPTWREVNGNQEFLGWLENVDAFSGNKRLDMLRHAFENNNTVRVMAFFNGFLNENAAFTSNQQPGPAAEPQVGLETLIAPGRASEGDEPRAQEGPVGGKVWTAAEITQFYRDVQRGVYASDPVERDRLENDIFLAQETGRISQ
jgi:hypothetical protein